MNSLVMHTDLSGNPSFNDVLTRVRQTALDAYAHQDIPFEKLVEELQPERSLSRNPLFQVMFVLQQQEILTPNFSLPNLEVGWYQGAGAKITTRFDIELHLWPYNDCLKGFCTYNRDLFEPETIERLLGHYEVLLSSIVASPDTAIAHLTLLPPPERHQLLEEWTQTTTDYPADQSIHQLFEAQAKKRPDAVAVVFGEQQLSYGELDTRSTQLAHYLHQQGVKDGEMVGICVERSIEMVVGLLGILKAGGAYVPLDPSYPQHRLDYMIEDANLSVLLTQQSLHHRLNALSSPISILSLDALLPVVSLDGDTERLELSSPERIAYLMYTSGSTGRPKGVVIPHQSVVRLVKNTNYLPFSESDRFLQLAPISFDAATLEIWGSLLNGAELIIMPPGQPSLSEIAQAVTRHHISTLWLTAGLFHLMVDDQLEGLKPLKYLLAGGDVLSVSAVQRVLAELPECQLINGYGPTENTTFTCCFPICSESELHPSVPIGKPIANTQVYILDGHLNPVPIGVPGELHIGGDGLALGYHRRPELTQEKFIAHPFSDKPDARLYKTGDLVRYRPDGNIEFLGRIDHQVKIRGFRIETGEIEATLAQQEAVQEAVVMARQDTSGSKQLVAYVVAHNDSVEEDQPELSDTQVSNWQGIFNQQVYTDLSEVHDPLFNIRGWLSNYDGQPIAEAQMRVWANDIVTQVLSVQPQSVWEIGCGTGMLLFQIAPHTQRYYGTDISQVSLEYVQTQIDQRSDQYGHVQLEQRQADNMKGVVENSFDVVLLSSIVQYFPNIEYLLRVIEQGIRVVKPGGVIVLADIRSYPLMRDFHTSVQHYKASPATTVQELIRSIDRQMQQETEFFVDPEFFVALKDQYPSISQVQVRLQRGGEVNELTKYRYTVLLHVETPRPSVTAAEQVDGRGMKIDAIYQRLQNEQTKPAPAAVCFSHLANCRLQNDGTTMAQVNDPRFANLTIAQLGQHSSGQKIEPLIGVDPEQLHCIAAELGYRVELCWSMGSQQGEFDAVYVPMAEKKDGIVLTPLTQRQVSVGQWQRYSNNPLSKQQNQQLVPQLKSYLEERLPEYMVPASWVMLPQLPLTPNGKVDRKALPEPEMTINQNQDAIAPRDRQELILKDIWEDLLNFRPISVNHNFFELGGHSLLAVRLMNRIEQDCGQTLPLSSLFNAPTIAELASVLRQKGHSEFSPLFPIQTAGSKPPLFCIHPGGGTAFCYFALAQLLGPDQPVYGLQSLGLEPGQEPLTRVEDMANVYLSAIRHVHPHGPYLLLGWSFGGVVALQMAHELTNSGESVPFLALLDTYFPSILPEPNDVLDTSTGDEIVFQLLGGTLTLPKRLFESLDPDQYPAFILEQARKDNLLPADFKVADIERLFNVLHLNVEAMRRYCPPTYSNPVTLFRAEKRMINIDMGPTLGWDQGAIANLNIQTIPGYHEYMLYQPSVDVLAKKLATCIAQARPQAFAI
ncbi:MAG: amino acid adenylation domain-containing protein [Cyanobacteria bacterium P01_F01_bin.150]